VLSVNPTSVLPGMFHGQESAKKIQLFLGPFKDFNGSCARFADLKEDKSRLSIALDGPISYQDQRNTQHKKEKKNAIIFSSIFLLFRTFLGQSCLAGLFRRLKEPTNQDNLSACVTGKTKYF
jgi:hypothetical protein